MVIGNNTGNWTVPVHLNSIIKLLCPSKVIYGLLNNTFLPVKLVEFIVVKV